MKVKVRDSRSLRPESPSPAARPRPTQTGSMDGPRCPPVTVEGSWSPDQSRAVYTKLELHFNSRRRSGGGDCRVELLPGDPPRATVHFRSTEVRARVLAWKQHEITVENQTIALRLHPSGTSGGAEPDSSAEPKSPDGEDEAPSNGEDSENRQSCMVLLENVPEDMSPDLLSALVESVSGSDEDRFRLERIWESGRAVVTFDSAADAERFLSSSPTSAKLQKHGLSVRALETPTSVRVEGLPPTAIADLLELYFEKNWALPEEITMIPEDQAAVVTFPDPRVVKSLCEKRDLVMKSFPVKVYPYYKSLRTALYGSERPVWKMPEAFVEPVHPVIWEFLLMKKLAKTLDDQMQPHFCCVDLEKPEVKLSPAPSFLRQKNLTEAQVDGWMSSSRDAFRRLMSQFVAFECAATPSAWKSVEPDVRSVLKEDAIPVFDASKQVLVVAGRLEDIKKIRPSVERITHKAMSLIDRQTNSISEAMTLPPPWFYILKQDGLLKTIQDISPEMKFSYSEGSQTLTVTGLPAEVYKTTSWIHEKKANMGTKQLVLDPSLLDFLGSVDQADLSRDLFTSQGISAVFTVDSGGVLLLGGSPQTLAQAETRMMALLSAQSLAVEDRRVVKLQGWADLIRQLLDTYNSTKKKTLLIQTRDRVAVSGFRMPVEEASLNLKKFLTNYSQKTIQDISQGTMEQTTAEGLKIILLRGTIQDQKMDVIINTISENMNLDQGAVSKALLGAAGSGLQAAILDQAGTSRTSRLPDGESGTSGGAEPDSSAEPKSPDGEDEAPSNGEDSENHQSCVVLLENVPEDMSPDLLSALVESVSGSDEDRFRLERIWESGRAVVTFDSAADAERFLSSSPTSAKLQKHGLSVRALETPTSVRVEGLPPTAIADLLELYFEKNWALPEEITMIPEDQAAVVTFPNPRVVKSVCEKRDLVMKSFPVKVYPYYKSLRTALYGSERPVWKMPEAFVEPVHPVIWEFLLMKKLATTLDDQMQPHFCCVDLEKPEVKLSPAPSFLRQKNLTEAQVDGWMSSSRDAFRRLMSQFVAFECAATPSAWKSVEPDVRSVLKEDAIPVFDASKQVLVVVGRLEDIKKIRPSVERITHKAMSLIDRQTNSISEAMTLPPPWFYILKQDGLLKTIQDISPEMKFSYSEGSQTLTVTGLPAEVYKTTSWIHEKKANMGTKQLVLDPSLLDFLGSVDQADLSRDLFTSQGISAVVTVDSGGVLLLGGSPQTLAQAETRMMALLSAQSLAVEDRRVVKLQGWADLIRQLLDTYNSTKKKTLLIQTRDRVAVSGFQTPVEEASLNLKKFLTNYSQVKETVRVKSRAVMEFIHKKKTQDWTSIGKDNEVSVSFDPVRPRIVLAGARLHVQEAKSCFKRLTGGLATDTLIIHKPGAKKYFQSTGGLLLSTIMTDLSCMMVLGPELLDEEEEDDRDDGNADYYCKVQTASGAVVSVSKADICSFAGDAVVNAVNEELKHISGVALALLSAAGPQLQKASNDLIDINGPLRPGDAVVTPSFNLPCRFVVHAVGPRYSDFDRKRSVSLLKAAVKESLKQADMASCSSVALPAISSGVFGFPTDLCAKTIAQAVREYCDQPGGPRSLTEINLLDNNTNTVTVLASAVNEEFSDLEPTIRVPAGLADAGASGYRGGRGKSQSQRAHWSNEQGGRRAASPHHSPGSRGGRSARGSRGSKWSAGFGGSGGSRGSAEPWTMEQTTAEGLKIVLLRGNIQDQKTDVIVNTISENMNLDQGAVSKALLEAAGSGLQAAILDQAGTSRTSRLPDGEVVVTDGFKLACRKVFHAVCPFWRNGGHEEETLISIIRRCLEEAEKLGMSSLSFPALGAGNLGFPRSLVSRVLLQQIHLHSRRRPPRHLTTVFVVVHPSDGLTVDSFTKEFSHTAATSSLQQEVTAGSLQSQAAVSQSQQAAAPVRQVSSPSLGVYRITLQQLTLQVSSGDITKVTSDVIVNSSNPSFTLKTGVSRAILEGAGPAVEAECALIVNSTNYQPNTMILTSAGKLPSRKIVHVIGQNDPQGIRDVVFSVLRFCEEHKFQSVSFPALGTGLGGVAPSAVADAMVGAVVDFVRKKQPQSVRSVQILIFQAAMLAEFHQSMKRRQGEEAGPKGVCSQIKDKLTSFFQGSGDEQPGARDLVLETEEFEPMEFQLCADSPTIVCLAKQKIETLIVTEQAQRTIQNRYIRHLSQAELDQLTALQRELTVSIRLERGREDQDSRIRLEGLTRDVLTAEADISRILRRVERTENLKSKALLTSELVQWQFQDHDGTMVDLDLFDNLRLEEALEGKQTVKIQIGSAKFTADPHLRKAVSASKQKEVELLRKQLKEDALPSHWDDMKTDLVKLFPVTPGSREFTEVEQGVKKTGLTLNIISIERVQNQTLWQSYQLMKKNMDQKNRTTNNERLLFHGTKSASVDLINNKGFNRSYAGTHGAMYGNGSYFAVDPVYSARNYAKPDASGIRRMFQARVLVGEYTQGKPGLITPPYKSGNVANLYDSVTDNTAAPSMFVVFSDIQAYPEYLITFK
uniref:Poly [ADP-ribose] polymerase n=1 Tax=Salarias fasciatus TaxID=181472 RepID=A0A672JFB8_SALFA